MKNLRTLFAAAGTWLLLSPAFLAQSQSQTAAEALGVAEVSLQKLDVPAEPVPWFRVDVALDGAVHELSFNLHSMRSVDFQLLVEDETGIAPADPGPVRTYRGGVYGLPGSVVAGTLREDGLHALVKLAPDKLFGIQPAGSTGLHGVYDASDVLAQDVRCGTAHTSPIAGGAPGPKAGGIPMVAQIGIDSDNQFYLFNGSLVQASQTDVESIMNAVEAIYDTAVGVVFEITVIIVRTSEPDSYAGDIFDRLDDLQQNWTTGLAPLPRDVAHLFSGIGVTSGVIGVAYLAGLCDFDFGFGASDTAFTSTFSSRVGLIAHEIGHNFGATHCNGTPDCMVMCSSLGGCAGDLSAFGSQAISEIQAFTSTVSCLGSPGDCGATSYGLAVGNTASLAMTGPLSPGTSLTLVYANPAGTPATARAGLASASASTPLGPGTALIDLSSVILFTSGVGFASQFSAATETIAIPSSPSLSGQTFFAQGAIFPGGGGGLNELTNGVSFTICP